MDHIHGPVWQQPQGAPDASHAADAYDALVVGAGITGLTCAIVLQESGMETLVVERDRPGVGVTGHSTAKVTIQHGLRHQDVGRLHGKDAVGVHLAANQAGMDWIRDAARAGGVTWRSAEAHVFARTDEEVQRLRGEADACAKAGVSMEIRQVSELPLPVEATLALADQGMIDPGAYIGALVDRFRNGGGTLLAHTTVERVKGLGPHVVHLGGGRVKARHVVLATHVPLGDKATFVPRVRAKRAYLLHLETDARPQGMHVSAGEPLLSIRPTPTGVVVAGRRHAVGHGEPAASFAALREDAMAFGGTLTHAWSTQDQFPFDGLPLIGRARPGGSVWTATGYQGWGLTMGTAAAILLAHRIQGEDHPWEKTYDPWSARRLATQVGRTSMLSHDMHTVKTLLGGHLKHADADQDRAPGQGAVRGGLVGKKAVAEVDGRRVVRSAVCPHMGCIVAWNDWEKSWDCPCHGSRFAADGKLLHGPASKPLDDA